jgi:hypothetical protein
LGDRERGRKKENVREGGREREEERGITVQRERGREK